MALLAAIGHALQSAVSAIEVGPATASGVSVVGSPIPYAGTRSFRVLQVATAGNQTDLFAATDASNKLYVSFWLYLAAYPGSGSTLNPLIIRNAASASVSRMRLGPTGLLGLANASNTVVSNAAVSLGLNQWYHVEYLHDASTNPGRMELRVNGATVATLANDAQGSYNKIILGSGSAVSLDAYFSDVIVNDSTGSFQNSWVGNQRLCPIRPIADGDAHEWNNTANAAGGATNYTLVNETTPDDTTSMVQALTAGKTDLYKMYAAAGSPIPDDALINFVALSARFRNNSAAATGFKLQLEKTSGGTKAESAEIVPNSSTFRTNQVGAISQTYPHPLIAYTDPDGGLWTPAGLPDLQAGVKITTGGTQRVQLTALWGYISYTPNPKRSSRMLECF